MVRADGASPRPQKQEHFWFLNTLVSIRVSFNDGPDGISVMEHLAPHGDSPPLHLHRDEDEIFHILEGTFTFLVDQKRIRGEPGQTLIVPKGIVHTYLVESREGGRTLTITAHGQFERFVRQLGRRTDQIELPPPVVPSAKAIEALTATARQFGIEVVGPPLS